MSRRLATAGYAVVRRLVAPSPAVVNRLIKLSESRDRVIFNGAVNDRKRRQWKYPRGGGESLTLFRTRLIESVRSCLVGSTGLTPRDMVVLHSEAGCTEQAPHLDYEPDDHLLETVDGEIPLGCVVALMDGTRLKVWPGSHRAVRAWAKGGEEGGPEAKIEHTEVDLSAGDCLFFRGDVVHAGSGYAVDNYRLHLFIDSDAVPRLPNRTWRVTQEGDETLRRMIV